MDEFDYPMDDIEDMETIDESSEDGSNRQTIEIMIDKIFENIKTADPPIENTKKIAMEKSIVKPKARIKPRFEFKRIPLFDKL